jgi:TPR repeat protein
LLHEEGKRGAKKSDTEAFKFFLLAAEQGFAEAQFSVGMMHKLGQGSGGGGSQCQSDDAEASSWFRKAAAQGHCEAQFSLGCMHESGKGGCVQSFKQAEQWYRRSIASSSSSSSYSSSSSGFGSGSGSDNGFAPALFNLAYLLEEKAPKKSTRQEEGGSSSSCSMGAGGGVVGGAFKRGDSIKEEETEAVEEAVNEVVENETKEEAAEATMGKGALVEEEEAAENKIRDAEVIVDLEAVKKESAEETVYEGTVVASRSVGNSNEDKDDDEEEEEEEVQPNEVEAVELYERAAKMDFPYAQYNLAVMHAQGRGGLVKDDQAALAWFTRAAELGDATAQHKLGCMFDTGKGVGTRNEEQAAK